MATRKSISTPRNTKPTVESAEAENFRLAVSVVIQTELNRLLPKIIERVKAQAEYNITTNVPQGIVSREDCAGHALQSGIASALAAYLQWDCGAAADLAADLLEETNFHDAAAAVRKCLESDEAEAEDVESVKVWNGR